MKYFIFFSFSLLSVFSMNAQCDTSIIGHWKFFSAFNGEVYFNLKNDSVFLTTAVKTKYPDTETQSRYIKFAKEQYGRFQYYFEKNGKFITATDSVFKYKGNYCYDLLKRILTLTIENDLGRESTEDVNIKLENGFLYLSDRWEDTGTMYEIVLEKIK